VGRAGRDGAPAWCELLFNYADKSTQQFFIDGANPAFTDILAVWEAVRQACAAEQTVKCTVEEWAQRAKVKNDMEVRTILGLIERARLIEREILPGDRSYTTRLLPATDPAELKRLAAGLDEKRLRDQRKLDRLIRFVDHPGCRHAFLLTYFGETMRTASCNACDRCQRKSLEKRIAPDEAQWIAIQKVLSCVARMKGRFGAQRVAQVLHGDHEETVIRHELDKLTTFGLLADWPLAQIRAVIDALEAEGCLEISPDEYRLVALSPKGRKVMMRTCDGFLIAWPQNKLEVRSEGFGVGKEKRAANRAEPDHALVLRLQKWARQTAAIRKVEPYRILNRQTVEAIAAARPENFSELETVKGMGPVTVQRYGRAILDLVTGESI
jgi:ATP-dependent DNA helicase RecQ